MKQQSQHTITIYQRGAAAPEDKIKAAQKVIVMTPEFNTMGSPLPNGTRVSESESAKSELKPYKAMVLLYLAGGADTFSMVVPQKCALYDEYVTVRKHLALRPDELQEIQTVGQACTKFGIHHGMPFLKELYDQDNAAFVSNIGSLVKPSTREQFRRGTVNQCKGMFSHSDQTKAAHVMDCRPVVGSSHGVAGRIGDEIGTQYTTSSFSMAGQSTWSQGGSTYPSIVGPFGVQRFKEYNRLKSVVANITMQQHGHVMSDEFARQFGKVIKTSEFLGSALQNTRLSTDYKVENGLDNQLRQVATLIAARKVRKAERDFFFVSHYGWDTHQEADLAPRLGQIDGALRRFVGELKAQGSFDSTVVVSQSEFGRTLTSNGKGSDHGWAGNHFVLGGSIRGGRVFNDFPASLLEGNDQDVGRGRLMPKYPWENMMVPIAEWMGMEPSQRLDTFPALSNFNSSHIIDRSSLFRD